MSKEISLTLVLLVSLAACIPMLLTHGELAPVVNDAEVHTEKEAIEVALDFLLSSPTFRTGIPESVNMTGVNRARPLTST